MEAFFVTFFNRMLSPMVPKRISHLEKVEYNRYLTPIVVAKVTATSVEELDRMAKAICRVGLQIQVSRHLSTWSNHSDINGLDSYPNNDALSDIA